MNFTESRLAKQAMLFGRDNMEKIASQIMTIVGCGRNGSSFATLAAYAGFSNFKLIDPDVVKIHNLNATIPFFKTDVGKKKVEVVSGKLRALDPSIRCEVYPFRVQSERVATVLDSSDVLICATDNVISQKFLNEKVSGNHRMGKNQKLIKLGSGAYVTEGRMLQLGAEATIYAEGGACLMCASLDEEENTNLSRVSFVLVNVLASLLGLQLLLSSLIGEDSCLERHDFVLYDILSQKVVALNRSPREGCEFCGRKESNG